jgi:hypothetical protein
MQRLNGATARRRVAYTALSINVMYNVDDPKKRAVGVKLSDGRTSQYCTRTRSPPNAADRAQRRWVMVHRP